MINLEEFVTQYNILVDFGDKLCERLLEEHKSDPNLDILNLGLDRHELEDLTAVGVELDALDTPCIRIECEFFRVINREISLPVPEDLDVEAMIKGLKDATFLRNLKQQKMKELIAAKKEAEERALLAQLKEKYEA